MIGITSDCSSVSKESACNTGDLGSIPGSGRSPGEGNGNPLQYSCLENPMNRGAWQAIVHGVVRVGHDLATKPPPPLLLALVQVVLLSPTSLKVERKDKCLLEEEAGSRHLC